ncbi:hypothetical protein D3C84_1033230 [compost metagenome]
MHVDAKRAAVDLRDPQVNQIDQLGGQAALLQITVDVAEGLVTLWGGAGVVDSMSHDESLSWLFEGLHRATTWSMVEDPCYSFCTGPCRCGMAQSTTPLMDLEARS